MDTIAKRFLGGNNAAKVLPRIIYVVTVIPWIIDLFIAIGNWVATIVTKSSGSRTIEEPVADGIVLEAGLQGDRERVLAAVKQNWRALQSASTELKGDREIVLEAVKQNGYPLFYASAALKGDREIVLEAVKKNGEALRHASAALHRPGRSTTANLAQIMELAKKKAMNTASSDINSGSGEDEEIRSSSGMTSN